jgi:hypothetical protein
MWRELVLLLIVVFQLITLMFVLFLQLAAGAVSSLPPGWQEVSFCAQRRTRGWAASREILVITTKAAN